MITTRFLGPLSLVAGLLLGNATTGSAAEPEAAPRPNIVVLLADDLGRDDVGWRGSPIATPHLDRLARSGAELNQHYVQPVCSPTRAALLTGRYPFRYGFQVGVVRPWADYGLSTDERLLSQSLQDVGYETAVVGKWHLGHVRPEYLPTHRGFDHQYGHYNGAIDYNTHQRDGGHDWHQQDQPVHDSGYSTDLLATAAVRIDDWKLIVREPANAAGSGAGSGRQAGGQAGRRQGTRQFELYRLSDDVSEQNDLVASHPAEVQRLLQRYDELAAQAVAPLSRGGGNPPEGWKAPQVYGH